MHDFIHLLSYIFCELGICCCYRGMLPMLLPAIIGYCIIGYYIMPGYYIIPGCYIMPGCCIGAGAPP